MAQLPTPSYTPANLVLSRQARYVAFAIRHDSRLASIAVWDTSTLNGVHFRTPPEYEWANAGFSPSGESLIVTNTQGLVSVIDAATGQVVRTIESGLADAKDVCHPDHPWIALLRPGRVTVYDYDRGEEISEIALGGNRIASMFRWSQPRGPIAVSTGHFVDLIGPDGKRTQSLQGHRHNCVAGFFDPSGRLFISASWDGTCRLWDVVSGQELGRIDGGMPIGATQVSRGSRLLTSSWDASESIAGWCGIRPNCGRLALVRSVRGELRLRTNSSDCLSPAKMESRWLTFPVA